MHKWAGGGNKMRVSCIEGADVRGAPSEPDALR